MSYVLWTSSGGFGTATSLGVTSGAQPFLDATGSATTYATYQDGNYDFWFLSLTGSTWTAPSAIGDGFNQYYGPLPATIASLGSTATVGFIDGLPGNVNDAASSDLVAGVWTERDDVVGPESFNEAAVIVSLGSGTDVLMAFDESNSTQIAYATRTLGVWSGATAITNCTTSEQMALTALPGGDALLAFRGGDGNLYWTMYSSSGWSTVAPLLASGSTAIDVPPAVSPGIGTDTAEIAFVQSGVAYQSSLSGSTWSTPVSVGGTGLVGVAIAASP